MATADCKISYPGLRLGCEQEGAPFDFSHGRSDDDDTIIVVPYWEIRLGERVGQMGLEVEWCCGGVAQWVLATVT